MKSTATKIQMYLAALRIVFSTARNSFGVIVLEDQGTASRHSDAAPRAKSAVVKLPAANG